MFHGLSPDGRKLAVGWDRGSGASVQRGAYLLDLRTGRRTDLPHLNNAPSFSPDGRHLVSANYAADRSLKTELVELDLRDGTARTLASGPSAEWLGSYSSDGRWILFNSTRTGTSDLYRIRRADGRIERLTDDPRYEAHAQFFDRDRKVIFHRQVAGDDYDIVVRELDQQDRARRRFHPSRGSLSGNLAGRPLDCVQRGHQSRPAAEPVHHACRRQRASAIDRRSGEGRLRHLVPRWTLDLLRPVRIRRVENHAHAATKWRLPKLNASKSAIAR